VDLTGYERILMDCWGIESNSLLKRRFKDGIVYASPISVRLFVVNSEFFDGRTFLDLVSMEPSCIEFSNGSSISINLIYSF